MWPLPLRLRLCLRPRLCHRHRIANCQWPEGLGWGLRPSIIPPLLPPRRRIVDRLWPDAWLGLTPLHRSSRQCVRSAARPTIVALVGRQIRLIAFFCASFFTDSPPTTHQRTTEPARSCRCRGGVLAEAAAANHLPRCCWYLPVPIYKLLSSEFATKCGYRQLLRSQSLTTAMEPHTTSSSSLLISPLSYA
jgi:hypothetical protein